MSNERSWGVGRIKRGGSSERGVRKEWGGRGGRNVRTERSGRGGVIGVRGL